LGYVFNYKVIYPDIKKVNLKKHYLRYMYGLLAVPLVILLRFALTPLIGSGTPYITLFPVTVAVALLAGLGPAILTGILGSIVTDYLFIEPLYAIEFNIERFSRMAVVILTSVFVGYLGVVLRAARAKANNQALALRESQADLNRAQAVAHTGSWRLDVKKNELTWSDENHRIFGIPKEIPITYETFLSAVHPDDLEYVDKSWKAALTGKNYDIKHRIVVDGNVMWVREKAELVFDNNGTLLGGFGTVTDITERKKAEDAVSVSEIRYRRLFEAARDGILILDADSGQIVDVNTFIKEVLGYSHEELLDKKLWEIGVFKNIAASKEAFLELQNKGYVRFENMPLETKDGRRIAVEFISNVYSVDHKKVIQCNIRNITDRVRAEDAVSVSEVRYRRLFEAARDGILILDADSGQIVDVNTFIKEVLGYSHEELLDKKIWEIGVFKNIAASKEAFLDLQNKGFVHYENLPLETKDGRHIAVEFVSNVYLVDHKKVIQCNIRDITARVQAEDAVSVSEIRYRRLFEAARDGILILDADSGQIVDVNTFIKEVLGYSHEELLDKKIWEIGVFKNIAASKEAFLDLQNKGFVHYENLPLETKDGRHISVEFVSNVYLVDQKKVIQCNIRDITARVRAEDGLKQLAEELERSNKDLEQFAYVASHDLQEPLRMIAGYTQLIQQRYKDKLDEDANQFIYYTVDGVMRMQSLITDLLTYSRLNTSSEALKFVDCREVLNEVLATLKMTLEESGADIKLGPMPNIRADRTLLFQLFQNLIGNAIKFRSDKPPLINITATPQDKQWLFSVSDNGIGMEPQYLERIFVIFQRLHTQDKYAGTGIGLAICKKIVERHGGRIWAESQPGKGSTFYFII